MTIRAITVAEGASGGAGTTTVYTVPAGTHMTLREAALVAVAGGGLVQVQAFRATSARILCQVASTALAGAALRQELHTTLEAGDEVRVARTGAAAHTWWISGTLYTP